jgi:flagellar protein FlgJ
MTVSAINPASSGGLATLMACGHGPAPAGAQNLAENTGPGRDPAAIKKAASQFEAIILRQLLAPSIEPIMSGGSGESQDSAAGVYGYMLTDTLATSLAQGGGLGLARMLEKQLAPRGLATEPGRDGPVVASSAQLHTLNKP